MKKFKIFAFVLLALLSLFTLAACKKGPKDPGDNGGKGNDLTYADGTELKLAVVHNNTKTTISFMDGSITGTGLRLADGKTYQKDDLKPVWQELQEILKVQFKDVYKGNSTVDNEYKAWQTLEFDGVDVLVGNADVIAEDGKKGKIVNLGAYLNKMPNFKKFLDENPIVRLSIVSDTEQETIYYAPYFDGFDDIEKYYLMRIDWLQILLDGEGDFDAEISDTFGDMCKAVAYQPYMPTSGTLAIESLNKEGTGKQTITKNYNTSFGNIVKYMNEHVNASTTGVELVNMLRDYIDEAYDGYYGTERSRLFAGYDACWDADELVALLRCIVTNTFALTGQNTTKVTGIFPREKTLNRTSDFFSLVSLFGVRGYESRKDYLYFDAQGNLRDARADKEYVDAINKLNTLYKEGLILQNFDTRTDTINKTMYQENLGFMIYDYSQTQTLYNDDPTTIQKCPDFNLTSVINPVAKWFDGSNVVGGVDQGTWMRFTESWRSVKTGGWCIPSSVTGDKLNAALKMFDYMYSEEGNILMSYGPEAWRSGNTISYKGRDIPELSEAALAELWDLAGGNYTNYARMYLGSTLPIGFVKDQGMEYQCTTEKGKAGAAVVGVAIAFDVVKHVTPFISNNLFYTMVPTTLPTTAEQDDHLSEFAHISTTGLYSKASGRYNIYIEIIKFGLGSDVELATPLVTNMPASSQAMVDIFLNNGGQQYLNYNRMAWNVLKDYYNDKIK